MNYSKEFEKWWGKNGVNSQVPALMNSYKEIAWKAYRDGYDLGFKDGRVNDDR